MAEDIKSLIDKIQQEGIQAAQAKAGAIIQDAEARARRLLKDAELAAEKIISSGKERVAKEEDASLLSLKQACRDTVLSLKKEINQLLTGIIKANLRQALSPQELGGIISSLVKENTAKEGLEVIITLNKEDLAKLEEGLLSQLKSRLEKGITLKQSDDIEAGFTISFDAGKSYFDFTDKALAQYLEKYLKPKLTQLLTG